MMPNAAMMPNSRSAIVATLFWVLLLAVFFAQVEIQIEGAAGWATSLPTWRIESHWLLDIFWGGRTLTGYHAWLFPFIALMFHFPMVFFRHWSWQAEARVIAAIMIFWVAEDFLWFVMNPAFGLEKFYPAAVPWHKHWLGMAPTDYWVSTTTAVLLAWYSQRKPRP